MIVVRCIFLVLSIGSSIADNAQPEVIYPSQVEYHSGYQYPVPHTETVEQNLVDTEETVSYLRATFIYTSINCPYILSKLGD